MPPDTGESPPVPSKPEGTTAEAIVFDKADRAEDLQRLRLELERLDTEIASVEDEITQLEGVDRHAGEARLESLRVRRQRLHLRVEAGEREVEAEEAPEP